MTQVGKDNINIKLDVDGSQSKTELDNLTRKAQVLKDELKGLKKGTQEYIDKNKEISQNTARMEQLRKEIGITAMTITQLDKLSKELNRELKNLTPGTASFVEKSKQLREVDDRLIVVRKAAKGVTDELEKGGNGFLDFVKKSAAFAGIQLGVQEAVSAIKQLFSESIDSAKRGSDSIADMEKSLNVTTEGARALREELAGIDTRTSQAELEGIAIAGGQLGVAAADVDEFTESVDQAVVALGDEFTGGVEDVTKSIGGLQKLYKQTADLKPDEAINKIGSSLNALGADGSATSPIIAEFTARVGQLGDLAPEITQTLGLGAAFHELGLSAEISSGGVTNVLLTASKETEKFSKQLGMTDKEFRKLLNSDPNEVLLRLAASFKGASNTQIVSTLDKLGIKSQEATKVVSLLANQTDIVRQKQALAAAEFQKGTSLMDEFAKKNNNAAAEVEKAEKNFASYKQELGDQLIPIYIKVLQFGGLVLDVLKAAPGFIYQNRTGFLLLAAALLVYNKEQLAARAASLRKLVVDKLAELQINSLTQAQTRLNAALASNPIGLVILVLAALAFGLKQLYDRSETFRASVDSLFAMLKPLGELFGQLVAQLRPLGAMLAQVFQSLGGGKAIMELFSLTMTAGVVIPLQLAVTNIQLTVDAFMGLWDVGKRVANFFGADFKVDPNGSFSQLAENFKRNAGSIQDTITGQDFAKAQQKAGQERFVSYQKELEQKMRAQVEAENKRKAQEAQAERDRLKREKDAAAESAAAVAEQDKKDAAERFKQREIELQRRLLYVEAGSQQELALKKQLVLLARDQELADEEKTQAERVTIRAKAQLELDKLNRDFGRAQAEKAKKQAEEEAEAALEIKKRQLTLEKDEFVRRAGELRLAAQQEAQKLKGTEAQVAAQRKLIQDKLNDDLVALEQERVARQAEVMRQIEAIDADIAVRRAGRAREKADNKFGAFATGAEDEAEKAARLAQLQGNLEDELANEQLGINEKLALIRKFHEDKAEIQDEYAGRDGERQKGQAELMLQASSMVIAGISDFQKIAADKELARLDRDKRTRLKKLDDEYKAGKLSKEDYEKSKAGIEESYDQKVRTVKRAAAQEEKKWNVAQSIMLGVLSVLQAKTLPEKILNGIAAALATAKIVATPIPEFAQGGVWSMAKSAGRSVASGVGAAYRSTRKYAHGGRINPVGGVADVGQYHSNGGIRMVDGATGEHLGEWEKGEAYMILSRNTVQNNGDIIDELVDTSMFRGGSRIRGRQGVYAEDGAVVGEMPAVGRGPGADSTMVVRAIDRQTALMLDIASRPMPAVIDWGESDTAYLEARLDQRRAAERENQA